MTKLRALLCVGLALAGVTVFGQQQGPATPPAPAPAIDLSGYWTPVMHEDAFERGPGN